MSDPVLQAFGFAALSGFAILIGGAIALQFRQALPWLLAFATGAVLAIALTILLPNALSLAGPETQALPVLSAAILGFVAYMMVDRLLDNMRAGMESQLGPASFFLHSMIDGLVAGLGFQVSTSLGLTFAALAIVHGLIHGISMVALVLRTDESQALAWRWLTSNCAAPLVGATASLFLRLQPTDLTFVVAGLAGLFLYIATAELLPRLDKNSLLRTGLAAFAALAIAGGHLALA